MLLIRLRVRPWRARCSPRSEGRVTTTVPSSCVTVMSRLTRSSSSPLGPLTFTRPVSTWTSTPSGTAIGCFPIRLIERSPDLGDELAAHARAPGVVARHHAPGGGDDGRSHPALDLGHLVGADVFPPPGPRDPLQAVDDRSAVLGVLEPHVELLAHACGLDREVLDVALLAQDPRELGLELGGRHHGLVLVRRQRVADPGEEVCDRVGLHPPYQLDFVSPGM